MMLGGFQSQSGENLFSLLGIKTMFLGHAARHYTD
jgi:hypothetical protein